MDFEITESDTSSLTTILQCVTQELVNNGISIFEICEQVIAGAISAELRALDSIIPMVLSATRAKRHAMDTFDRGSDFSAASCEANVTHIEYLSDRITEETEPAQLAISVIIDALMLRERIGTAPSSDAFPGLVDLVMSNLHRQLDEANEYDGDDRQARQDEMTIRSIVLDQLDLKSSAKVGGLKGGNDEAKAR